MSEHDSEYVDLSSFTIESHQWSARPEVDLSLLARRAFHPPHRQFHLAAQTPDEPFDAVIVPRLDVFRPQILVDPLGGQAAMLCRFMLGCAKGARGNNDPRQTAVTGG